MTIDEVEDIEVLRRAAKVLEAENLAMAKTILKLKRELFEMKHGRPEQLKLQIAELEEQLARRNKMLFGDKSEKQKSSKVQCEAKTEKTKQIGHGRREQPALEVVETVHTAAVEGETCNLCGGSLHASKDFYEESEEIDIIERKFVLKKHRRQKYKCGCGSCIKTAPGPAKLFSGARYSVGFALHIAISKYADHAPLERQVRGMKREGLEVTSQTLFDYLYSLAKLLEPAHDRNGKRILQSSHIGVDETHWKMMSETGKTQGGKGKRWQVWAVCCADGVHYSFEDSRSAEAAKRVLGDYAGIILTDGYAVYDSLKKRGGKFIQAHCWAHVRRKFIEIEEQHPGKCKEVLDLIGQLYEVERLARGKPPDEVLSLRHEKSKPILLAIQNWAFEMESFSEGALGKAISYMGNLWDGLRVFLDHAEVSLDNNATERVLRGVVLGRKNHYGSRSERGTKVAAIFYSLIESAKLAGVSPHTYLQAAVDAALRREMIPLPHEII